MASSSISTRFALAACSVLALAGACGGRAIDTSGDGDGDGDRTGPGPGDGDVPVAPGSGGMPIVIPDCTGSEAIPGVKARYERVAAATATRGTTDFFAFPWPEISRRLNELNGFPNPPSADGCMPGVTGEFAELLVDAISPHAYRDYLINLSSGIDQHARHPGIYVSFDGALGSSLPSPAATLSPDSPIFLVHLDSLDPAHRSLTPLRTRVFQSSRYLPPNTIAALPVPGFPLLPGNRYALVVKRTLGSADGSLLGSSAEFEARKTDACNQPYEEYLAAFESIEQSLGIARSDVAALVLFEPGDPQVDLRAHLATAEKHDGFPMTVVPSGPASDSSSSQGYHLVRGIIHTPIMQRGAPPYLPPLGGVLTGGEIPFDPDAAGEILPPGLSGSIGGTDEDSPRTEEVEFTLTLPSYLLTSPAVADVPLVIYAPGTGGSAESAVTEGIAQRLAQLGYATFTTTPVMHGARAHSENIDPDLRTQLQQLDSLFNSNYEETLVATVESGELFFNPLNLKAARGNVTQAALDYAWQFSILAKFPVEVTIGGQPTAITFDPEHMYFFGHSQGAGIGPLLASVPQINGAVLSGASGHIPSTILHKTKPADTVGIAQMIDYLVCDDSSEPLDELHPVMGLIGHWFEPVDAQLSAAEFTIQRAKDLFVVVGRDDAYAPPESNHALTTAALLQQITPPTSTGMQVLEGQNLLAALYVNTGYEDPSAMLRGNLNGDTNTGAFRIYHDDACADDHFVYVCTDEAVNDWSGFFETALTGIPEVP